MKLITKIVGATLGLAMAIGVGLGVANFNNKVAKEANAATQEGTTVTFVPGDFSGQGTSGSGGAVSTTAYGITVSSNKGYGTTQFRVYSGGKLTISSTVGNINSITFTTTSGYAGGLSNQTGLSQASWEFTTTAQARITQIVVTYTSGGGSSPTVTGISASLKDGDYYAGNTLSESDFNITAYLSEGDPDHPTSGFTWTVNDVANGTLVLGNNNTIVVTYQGSSDTIENVEAIRDPNWDTGFKDTKVATFASDLETSVDTVEKYYVAARITAITNSAQGHGNAVDEDGTAFAIYYMYNYNGLIKYGNMPSDNKPVVGDVVVLYGVFTKYNDAPEIKNARVVQRNGSISFAPVTSIDLGTSDTTTSASDSLLTWEVPGKFNMQVAKSTAGTATNNYYPGTAGQSYTSTRFYKNSEFTLSPATGIVATKAVFYATSEGYASAFAGSTATNATLSSSGMVVTLTFTNGAQPASVKIGGTCGFTSVEIYYSQTIKEAVEFEAPTRSSLYFKYHKTDGNEFTYSNVAFRFGTLIEKELWDMLDADSDIEGYGVLVSTVDYIETNPLKNYYASAESDANVDNYYKLEAEKPTPTLATASQKGDLVGNYYIWNVFYNIPDSNLTEEYAATAYIIVDGEVVFLKEERTSAAKIAYDLIRSGTSESAAEGALKNLADQYSA